MQYGHKIIIILLINVISSSCVNDKSIDWRSYRINDKMPFNIYLNLWAQTPDSILYKELKEENKLKCNLYIKLSFPEAKRVMDHVMISQIDKSLMTVQYADNKSSTYQLIPLSPPNDEKLYSFSEVIHLDGHPDNPKSKEIGVTYDFIFDTSGIDDKLMKNIIVELDLTILYRDEKYKISGNYELKEGCLNFREMADIPLPDNSKCNLLHF